MNKPLILLFITLFVMSCSENSSQEEGDNEGGNGKPSVTNNLKAGLVAHYVFDNEDGKDL